MKLNKIFILMLLVVLLFLPNFVQAIDVNMNLNNVSNSIAPTITDTLESYNPSGTVISTLNSLPEAELGLTNILSIILIVIGILLILLAIAIIIRLK